MLELALDAELSSLATMADAVEGYMAEHGVPPAKAMQLVLALDEVVTNVITHGGLASGNAVTVTVDVQGNAILAAVEDPGPPFDPLSEAPPAPLTGSLQERPIGGLGLHIVRSIMQSLAYERADDRNRLVMRLDL